MKWWIGILATMLMSLWIIGCSDSGSDELAEGEFITAGGGADGRNYDAAQDGATGDGDLSAEDGDSDDAEREIVEADLFRVIDDTIYVLNQHRGLAIIDFSDPDNMRIVGRLALKGIPKEMFVDNGVATIQLTGLWELEEQRYRTKSEIVTVDVSNSASPILIETFNMAGTVVDSRQVGDVIYIVASQEPWWDYCYTGGVDEDRQGSIEIISINVADPNNVFMADSLSFEGSGWGVYVNQTTMYVAAAGWDYWYYDGEETGSEITYVDISDPEGTMVKRGQFNAVAHVPDRFKMYQYGDVFAVISATNEWNGDTYLETFDVADPDNIAKLGQVEVMREEELHASNFSGMRAYIVTYRNTDPLFVVDFSEPTNPTVLGNLVIPGWSTHLEIRGTTLVGVGVDDTDNWQTKVSLFDVTDPTDPTELDSISLGQGYSWSEALYDWKAFKVYEQLDPGLILVPTSGYSENWNAYVNELYLIDFNATELTKRGSIASDTPIRRGFIAGDYLATLSESDVQLIDYTDRDNPEIVADVQVAGYIEELHRCSGMLCDTSDVYGNGTLRVRMYEPGSNGDNPVWKSAILDQAMDSSYHSLHVVGDRAYVMSMSYGYGFYDREMGMDYEMPESSSKIHAFDLSSDTPEYLGEAELSTSSDWYGVQMSGVIPSGIAYSIAEAGWDEETGYGVKADFFDVRNMDSVSKVATLGPYHPLMIYGSAGPITEGNNIWGGTCEPFGTDSDDRPILKCYAVSVDASAPPIVRETARINIPGQLIGLNSDQDRLVAIDRQFGSQSSEGYTPCSFSLEILSYDGSLAHRLVSLPLYEDEYCYYEYDGENYTDGGDSPSVEPSYAGDSAADDTDVEETTPEPSRVEKRKRLIDEEDNFYYSNLIVQNNRAFVSLTNYGGYYGGGVATDMDVAVADGYGCGSPYEYENTNKMQIRIYKLSDGSKEKTIALDNVSSLTAVDGGGMIAYGVSYYYGAFTTNKFWAYYIDDTGNVTELDMENDTNTGSYYIGQAVRIGSTLYMPLGWGGIKAIEL